MIFGKLFPAKKSSSTERMKIDPVRLSLFFRRNKWMLLLCGLSLFLLLFLGSSSSEKDYDSNVQLELSQYSSLLEAELEETLTSVSGVGRCIVMITFSDAGETVYAYDEDLTSADGRMSEKREYVLLSSRSEGMILKIHTPSVLGVAVICEGGDSSRVKNDVTEVLTSTLGISADRISVKKRNVQE